eukprot:983599-Prymnesium_polylepis.2
MHARATRVVHSSVVEAIQDGVTLSIILKRHGTKRIVSSTLAVMKEPLIVTEPPFNSCGFVKCTVVDELAVQLAFALKQLHLQVELHCGLFYACHGRTTTAVWCLHKKTGVAGSNTRQSSLSCTCSAPSTTASSSHSATAATWNMTWNKGEYAVDRSPPRVSRMR